MHKFLAIAIALASTAVVSPAAAETPNRAQLEQAVKSNHAQNLKRLRDWIALPTIAAEGRNTPQGAEYMRQLLLDAGFQQAKIVATDGKPGVFATLDAGAPTTLGIYFMYDVKQFDPAEWSSPPLEARIVDKPGMGRAMVGRGATNQKGPEATFLAALHAIRAAGRKLPVNLVLVAEGEEEIGSPNFPQIVLAPEGRSALSKSVGVFMPEAAQEWDGSVIITLGNKGDIECDLIATSEKWGRGATRDVHSSLAARLDQPAWHLVQALNTLVKADGHTPAVDGFFAPVRPLSAQQREILEASIPRKSEAAAKKALGVSHWYGDTNWYDSLILLESKPTINIEGLVGGYTGPGGKTILPHRAVAKIDMRLVPDMTALGTLELLKAHLAKHGFGDIEVNMTGGYDPTQTEPDTQLIQAQLATYKKLGINPILWPRNAGSWPGVTFTGAPVNLPAGDFGLGHGNGAHAPDEYYVIESSNPKISGIEGAIKSHVEYLYALA